MLPELTNTKVQPKELLHLVAYQASSDLELPVAHKYYGHIKPHHDVL
jgi:hypothetical protein